MSAQWLAIIENALGSSLASRSIEKVSLEEFRALLEQLVRFHNSAKLPERAVSQLRPRLDGDGSWRATGGLRSKAPHRLRAMVKSLLLLADSVALQDPLIDVWISEAARGGKEQRLALLRDRMRDVARIADLIRSGVVVVYSPPPGLISQNSGYGVDDPAVLGDVPFVDQSELTETQRALFGSRSLQFDWDAAWVAHALTHGPQAPFADSLAVVRTDPPPPLAGQSLLFLGDHGLVDRVQGLLWEHRVRSYYGGQCDPGPMTPATSELFCSILRLVRQAVTSRDERNTQDYYFLLSNPLLRADKVTLDSIIALRAQSAEFAAWRSVIRQSLDYAYHANHQHVNEHAEFMQTMQGRIDEIKVQMASGRRGRLLAQCLETGDAFTVGGAAGIAQYLLHADLAQSLVAAPAGAVGAILFRVIKTLCLDDRKAIQAHFVAFRQ